MRTLNLRFARLHNERGAAAALVAISLVAILGMVVLVVDVGGLLTLRRRLVAASDAAALAAAQSCAREQAGEALSQADTYAEDNVTDAVRYHFTQAGCGNASRGFVTVGYKADKQLFFAPVLGVDDSSTVGHKSTAIWGPALGGNPVPIKVSVDDSGKIPCEVGPGPKECNMWFNNPADGDLDSSSSWGFMNLNEWDVAYDANCSVAGGSNDRGDWITGAQIVDATMTNDPTFVCMGSGHSATNWYDDLVSQIGEVKYFPVNDPGQMNTTSGKEKYAIIGFTPLKIVNVLKGNDPAAIGTPGTPAVDETCKASHTFTQGEVLAAWTLNGPGCPGGVVVDSMTQPKISKQVRGTTINVPEGTAWTWNPAFQEITWNVATFPGLTNLNNMDVEFDWHVDGVAGTPGACGIQDSDPNGICLQLLWEGPIIGGFDPCFECTTDFGIRAIRLDKLK